MKHRRECEITRNTFAVQGNRFGQDAEAIGFSSQSPVSVS